MIIVLLMTDMLMFDFETGLWFDAYCSGDAPCARSGHSACIVAGDKMVVFGGLNNDGKYMNDVHVLDTKLFAWSKPKTKGPPMKARAYHAEPIPERLRRWAARRQSGRGPRAPGDVAA